MKSRAFVEEVFDLFVYEIVGSGWTVTLSFKVVDLIQGQSLRFLLDKRLKLVVKSNNWVDYTDLRSTAALNLPLLRTVIEDYFERKLIREVDEQ